MHDNLDELINYRIQQSFDIIKEVELQIRNKLLKTAVNRIYYGMFYILLALALKRTHKTSKHQQIIGQFNKEFVKKNKVDKQIGSILHKAFEDRTDNDYTGRDENQILDLCYDINLKYNILIDTHIISKNEIYSPRGRQTIFSNALNSGIYA